MTFAPGDRVHLAGIGTGSVLERRGSNRYAIEIKGRVVVASARDLQLSTPDKPPRRPPQSSSPGSKGSMAPPPRLEDRRRSAVSRTASIDLHGHSADEAVSALEAFVNDAILDGHSELRVIHGRTGGRVKSAVHTYLRRLSHVASFHLDPRNPGVTIVKFA